MNILVIGLGSMGKRRIRLIRNNFPAYKITGIDAKEERAREAEELYQIETFPSIEGALEKGSYDCAFICTSPLSHNAIIKSCLQKGLHIFTEINLVADGYDENIAAAKEKGLTLFLSSTFFYREEIKYVMEQVSRQHKKLSYTYHVGQYLPDWHPWESFKNFFLGDKRTNGCREILTIDLPWIVKTFGKIKTVHVIKNKITDLEIDYPDSYIISFAHENGNIGVFMADVAARNPFRELRVSGEDLLVTWNGKPDGLEQFDIENKKWEAVNLYEQIDTLAGYSATITENAYLEEIKTFFDVVEKKAAAPYGFEDDYYVLNLIDRIESES